MRYIKKLFGIFLITFLSIIFFTGCGSERFELIEVKCGKCHEASIVYEKKRSPNDWDIIIFGMKARGLKITADEEEELMRVLKNSLSLE